MAAELLWGHPCCQSSPGHPLLPAWNVPWDHTGMWGDVPGSGLGRLQQEQHRGKRGWSPPSSAPEGSSAQRGQPWALEGEMSLPVPPQGLWAELWQAGALIKCLPVFKMSLCKAAWQKAVVLHGEQFVLAATSWRWEREAEPGGAREKL